MPVLRSENRVVVNTVVLKGKKRQARYVELTEADRERYDAINMDGGIPTLAKIGRLRQELALLSQSKAGSAALGP